MTEIYQNYIKCVVCGDGTVGKTCMLMSYVHNSFPEDYIPTVFDNFNKNVKYNNEDVNLCLWDTAGQEDFDRLRPNSYPDTNVFLLTYSVVDPASFYNTKDKWIVELKEFFYNQPNGLPPIVLCGTKTDLRNDEDALKELRSNDERAVSKEDGKKMAEEIGARLYVECSSKTLKGLDRVFDKAIKVAKESLLELERKKEDDSKTFWEKCCTCCYKK